MKDFFKSLYRMWMKFAKALGKVQTTIILFLIYFLGIGPIAVIAFVFRKDFLDKSFRKEGASFWRTREAEKPNIENAKRQF